MKTYNNNPEAVSLLTPEQYRVTQQDGTERPLPQLEAFRIFPTKGPEGIHPADINRRAAAIECYLDLRLEGYPSAQVVWTNYKRELATYHGAF